MIIILIVIVLLLFFLLTSYFIQPFSMDVIGGGSTTDSPDRAKYIRELYERYGDELTHAKDKFTYGDIDFALPYKSFGRAKRHSMHVGQFKLFLSELRFLNAFVAGEYDQHAPRDVRTPFIVIYAGSAPGHHDAFLSMMFPNMRMILIDPSAHGITYKHDPNLDDIFDGRAPINLAKATLFFKFSSTRDAFKKPNGDYQEDQIFPRPGTQFIAKNGNIDRIHYAKLNDVSCAKRELERALLSGPADDVSSESRVMVARKMIEQICVDLQNTSNTDAQQRRFYISEDYFTEEYAQEFANLSDASGLPVIYISDIRSRIQEDESRVSDMDILANNAQQHIWINALNPVASMLKFRTPYGNAMLAAEPRFASTFARYKELFGADILAEYARGKYVWLPTSRLDLQAFQGVSSTETRAIITRKELQDARSIALAQYDAREYENRFMAYNLYREFAFYDQNQKYFSSFGIDGCADCNIAIDTFETYMRLALGNDPRTNVDAVKRLIGACLSSFRRTIVSTKGREIHGDFVSPISLDEALNF